MAKNSLSIRSARSALQRQLKDVHSEKDGRKFFVFESVSKNQDGQEVVRGTWTNIVR